MIPELDPRAQKEKAHYREVTTRSRFLQQIFLGLGGAIVFGVVGVLSRTLLESATEAFVTQGLFSAPALGLAGVALAGIACLYIGAKMLSNTIMMEQDYSAKKIALATSVRAPQLAPAVEVVQAKPANLGPITTSIDEQHAQHTHAAQAPELVVRDVSNHQRVVQPSQHTHTV